MLYPKVEAKYGATYGFTVDVDGGDGYWETSYSTTLKNHLMNGGVAVGHVPNHFIAILEYSSSSGKYHIYDSYPTSARGTAAYGGDCWVTPAALASGKLDLDWFCLLSLADDGSVTAPKLTISPTTARHGDTVTVKWDAVDNATSYWYRVNQYDAEPTGREIIPYTQIIPKTTTSKRIFTVTAPEGCKYLRITVGAVGETNSKTTTKTIAVGPDVALPTDGLKYIVPDDINGTLTNGGKTTVWNAKNDVPFDGVWWPAAVCTMRTDGTYDVTAVYASGDTKSISVTDGDIIIASHADANSDAYSAVKKLAVGDRISIHGLYLDYGIIRGNGYILVNGELDTVPTVTVPDTAYIGEDTSISWTKVKGATSYNVVVKNAGTEVLNTSVTARSISIPAQANGDMLDVEITPCNSVYTGDTATAAITLADPVPKELTVNSGNTDIKGTETAFTGYKVNTNASQVLASFNENSKYLQVRDKAGSLLSAADIVCTGYTANIVSDGVVIKSYELAVIGDLTGDGRTSTDDYIAFAAHIKSSITLEGAYLLASDLTRDDVYNTSDLIALKTIMTN